MNSRGFTLVELLGALVIVAIVFGVGLYFTSGTFSSSLTTIDKISENEIYETSKTYILENYIEWKKDDNFEYTCVKISDLVENGYFEFEEVSNYADNFTKVYRNVATKVIENVMIVEECN